MKLKILPTISMALISGCLFESKDRCFVPYTVCGYVQDTAGSPIENAKIWVETCASECGYEGPDQSARIDSTQTDANGFFKLKGAYRKQCHSPGFVYSKLYLSEGGFTAWKEMIGKECRENVITLKKP